MRVPKEFLALFHNFSLNLKLITITPFVVKKSRTQHCKYYNPKFRKKKDQKELRQHPNIGCLPVVDIMVTAAFVFMSICIF